jgi:hypothetical protein
LGFEVIGAQDATRPRRPPATAQDVIALLEHFRTTRGLPLVRQTDNGSSYTADVVQDYVEKHQVLLLLNLPHTPPSIKDRTREAQRRPRPTTPPSPPSTTHPAAPPDGNPPNRPTRTSHRGTL